MKKNFYLLILLGLFGVSGFYLGSKNKKVEIILPSQAQTVTTSLPRPTTIKPTPTTPTPTPAPVVTTPTPAPIVVTPAPVYAPTPRTAVS